MKNLVLVFSLGTLSAFSYGQDKPSSSKPTQPDTSNTITAYQSEEQIQFSVVKSESLELDEQNVPYITYYFDQAIGNPQWGTPRATLYIYANGNYAFVPSIQVAHKCGTLILNFDWINSAGNVMFTTKLGGKFFAGITYTEPITGYSALLSQEFNNLAGCSLGWEWTQYSSCGR